MYLWIGPAAWDGEIHLTRVNLDCIIYTMDINEQPEYNNEAEDEVAQVLDITRNLAAVKEVQDRLALQRARPSLAQCEDCGEDIPIERQRIALGCTRCIVCQSLEERRQRGFL